MSAVPQIIELENGVRLATVAMPHMASVSIGLWTGVGSRHETIAQHGMAHFVEHMLFKGTPTRSAKQISRHIEGIGASIDGFTVEDHTAYQSKAPADQFAPLFEVLADFYRNPVFDPTEIASERQVIHEEIAMVRDQPSQYLEDLISEAIWGETHPLGRSITGTATSLDGFQRSGLLEFFRRAYCGANTIISVAGKIDPEEVRRIVAGTFEDFPQGRSVQCHPAPEDPVSQHRFEAYEDHEQDHLALAWRSVDRFDPRRFAHGLLNVILGDNMSSRLFQMLREKLGLCYEIQSDYAAFEDAGSLQIYVALSPENLDSALDAISVVIEGLCKKFVTDAELAEAKSYLIGQSRISLENTASQMSWAGECLLFFNEWIDPEEAHARLEAVTVEEVRDAARFVFLPENLSTALVGAPESESILHRWVAGSGA